MTVLVISQPQDLTTDLVVVKLHTRQVPLVRIDIGDFPQELRTVARLERTGWGGHLRAEPHRLDLSDVSAVYYRRPAPFRLPPSMSASENAWAGREARHGFGGLLAALPCRWVNHPHSNAAATKPAQLAGATGSGLNVPATLITNEADAAREFVERCRPGAVYKTLSGSPADVGPQAIYTQRVGPDDDFSGVAATAHLFQEFVPKAFEVRLTVVGQRMFAARIDASTEATRLDWRTDYDAITFTAIETPSEIAEAVSFLMSGLGLRFAALDFVVDPDGRWWFLDLNANGQWGFVEEATGQPIADAIAADLQGATP